MFQDPELEVLLPVHNEADIIELVTREIYGEISPNVAMQFIVCEKVIPGRFGKACRLCQRPTCFASMPTGNAILPTSGIFGKTATVTM